ncbi:hypothetical protein [Nocardiopsis algeriensis]|uniref:Uncharacterized protein n=1 Tax=Nocardiopsis algeriensis TaxID=1478215 RepID=A0A841IR55_9ACTN|nr:hypothetical protein [Nocardiopsis algeriensis]MBB6119756.1 hypothetical protein [Nocardiopsis algeriensis]
MPVRNLTPHVVTVVDEDARVIRSWPSAAEPARVEAVRIPVGHLDDATCAGRVPLVAERRTRANLPEPQEGVWLIVSSVVGSAHPERSDLLVPTDLVRDCRGVVTGCRSFAVSGAPPRGGLPHQGSAREEDAAGSVAVADRTPA